MQTRQVYLEELARLKFDVVQMGGLLEEAIRKVMSALKTTDIMLAKEIIDGDDKIDQMERDIERECIHLIARQQPVAADLRKIASIMRIISDLERIADHCSDISEYIIKIAEVKHVPMPTNIENMMFAMKTMVADTIDSFINEDTEKAFSVMAADDKVDQYFEDIMDELCENMEQHPEMMRQYMEYLMIVKYAERMADHSTNIAEWITYIVTGTLIF